jgi:hypothetical protein
MEPTRRRRMTVQQTEETDMTGSHPYPPALPRHRGRGPGRRRLDRPHRGLAAGILIAYVVPQRWIVGGLTAGATKG